MKEVQNKAKFILATKRAIKGDITGRDLTSIALHQLTQSSDWDWSHEDGDSFAMSIMIALQVQFN